MYNKTKLANISNNKIMLKTDKAGQNINNIILPDKISAENTIILLNEKIMYIQKIIQKTILSVQLYKKCEIFSNSDVNICVSSLNNLYEKTNEIVHKLTVEPFSNANQSTPVTSNHLFDPIIHNIQLLIDKLSVIICGFGTSEINDLLFICFGSEFKNAILDNDKLKHTRIQSDTKSFNGNNLN